MGQFRASGVWVAWASPQRRPLINVPFFVLAAGRPEAVPAGQRDPRHQSRRELCKLTHKGKRIGADRPALFACPGPTGLPGPEILGGKNP